MRGVAQGLACIRHASTLCVGLVSKRGSLFFITWRRWYVVASAFLYELRPCSSIADRSNGLYGLKIAKSMRFNSDWLPPGRNRKSAQCV